MKKIVLSLVAFGTLFGASNEEILKLYSGAPSNVKISVENRISLKEAPGYDLVILKVEHEGGVQNEFVFTKDNLAFFDIIDIKSQESLKVKYENEINNKKIATQYKNEKAENIVKIGNDPKKETLVVFTDPECPYCRQELSQIDKRLEKFNIEMIFVPVHGISSYQKSALILKHTRKAKTDNDKIAIVKKYYDEKITLTEKVEDKELENIQKIAKKFQNAGVTGVPRIVEKSKIIK